MGKLILLITSVILLAACSVFPYQSEFSCEGKEDFGKCVPVEKAYDEAVTGTPAGPPMKRAGDKSSKDEDETKGKPVDRAAERRSAERESYSTYKASMYAKLSNLLNQPVAPVVSNPTPKRALILPYTTRSEGRPLYLPRYVFFFTEEPTWLLGQYLNSSDAIGPTVGTLRPMPNEFLGGEGSRQQ